MSTHAFVIVDGEPDAYGRIYGPQGKQYTVIGRTPDGRTLGVAEVYPSELAIIASPAHEGEYLGRRWEELLHGPHVDDVDWEVLVEDPELLAHPDTTDSTQAQRWVRASEADPDAIVVTSAGNPRRRPPVPLAHAESFDPDWMPRVGTVRVVDVPEGEDQVQVVRTGADGLPKWVTVKTTAA